VFCTCYVRNVGVDRKEWNGMEYVRKEGLGRKEKNRKEWNKTE
jgi:hypothetical protein